MDWPNYYGLKKPGQGCWVAGNTIRIGSDGELLLCRRKVITLPNILENPDINIQHVLKERLRGLCFASTPAFVFRNRATIDCSTSPLRYSNKTNAMPDTCAIY